MERKNQFLAGNGNGVQNDFDNRDQLMKWASPIPVQNLRDSVRNRIYRIPSVSLHERAYCTK